MDDTYEQAQRKWAAGLPLTRAEAAALVRATERRCLGPLSDERRQIVTQLLRAGYLSEARAQHAEFRAGCGADFNDIILSGPLDGQEHPYRCPACGVTGTYRAPQIALKRGPLASAVRKLFSR